MSDSDNYQVGYCRPPKTTRFKPGQSGNPKGRPKGAMDTHRLIDAIISKKVSATIDGTPIRISKKQAMLLRLANSAASGDLKSMQLLLPHMLQIDEKKAARARMQADDITSTDREILNKYLGGNDNE